MILTRTLTLTLTLTLNRDAAGAVVAPESTEKLTRNELSCLGQAGRASTFLKLKYAEQVCASGPGITLGLY